MKISRYDSVGRILGVEEFPDEFLELQEPGYIIGEFDRATYFVEAGAAALRTVRVLEFDSTSIAADGVDFATINDLPAGTMVDVDGGGFFPLGGGTIEFVTDMPGTYRISIDAPPYLPQTIEIVAV